MPKTTKETKVKRNSLSEADRRRGAAARVRAGRRPKDFDPCVNMPTKTRNRFKGAIRDCHRVPSAAIRLFCVECMGYQLELARTCTTKTCPLWALNRRYFKENGEDKEAASA